MTHVTIIAHVRNQAPYLIEWLAHHLALGAQDFVFCVYGSSDGTARLTRRLAAMGYGQHLKMDGAIDDPRRAALDHARATDSVARADWVGLWPITDFLSIDAGHGRFEDLFAEADATGDALSLERFTYSSGDQKALEASNVTERFRQRHTEPALSDQPALARRPDLLGAPQGAGTHSAAARINRFARRGNDDLAQMLATCPTERAPQIAASMGAPDGRMVSDDALARLADWRDRYKARLFADTNLRKLTAGGLEKHKARAAQAKADPELARLLD